MNQTDMWRLLCVLFVAVGALHFARAARTQGITRKVRATLGVSCLAWAVGAYMLRFAPGTVAYVVMAFGVLLMVVAALLSAGRTK